MIKKWQTLPEIALDRGISLDQAQGLVERAKCPKIFTTTVTYYLL